MCVEWLVKLYVPSGAVGKKISWLNFVWSSGESRPLTAGMTERMYGLYVERTSRLC